MSAFYNEIDPFAAAWLRELIKAGHIAPGVVDERSIEDIKPDELKQYTQCHFFAGIGVWSYALRRAGWPDDRPVWTGSCPCQPFSTAGKRTGTADERHLWPSFFHLIEQHKPVAVFGEQVEAAIRQGWLDLVQTDLEGIGYTFGAVGLPACGFGAPHIRQRLYFVADSSDVRCNQRGNTPPTALQGQRTLGSGQHAQSKYEGELQGRPEGLCRPGDELADSPQQCVNRRGHSRTTGRGESSNNGELGHTDDTRPQGRQLSGNGTDQRIAGATGLVNGFWREADWIACRDGKYRPVESGTFPLAHGAAARVGRLRGYGNALVAPVAEAFVKAFLATEEK